MVIIALPTLLSLNCGASSKIFNQNDGNLTTAGYGELQSVNPSDDVNFQTFYNGMSTDGDWIPVDQSEIAPDQIQNSDDPSYVDQDVDQNYIWRPYEAHDQNWNPYSNGRWEWTNRGWVWLSDYDWGWAAYHYGRWWYSPIYGWVWSPGHTWAASWVTFYCDDDYIGWYPVTPWSHWHWDNDYVCVENNYYYNYYNYTYVYEHNFNQHISPRVIIDPRIVPGLQGNSSVGVAPGGYLTSQGPKVQTIENSTGTKITPVTINYTGNVSDVGIHNKNLTTYKPNNSNGTNTKTENKTGNVVNTTGSKTNTGAVTNGQKVNQNTKQNTGYVNQNDNGKKINVSTPNVNVTKTQKTNGITKSNTNPVKTGNKSSGNVTVSKNQNYGNKTETVKKGSVNSGNVPDIKTNKNSNVTKSNNTSSKSGITSYNTGNVTKTSPNGNNNVSTKKSTIITPNVKENKPISTNKTITNSNNTSKPVYTPNNSVTKNNNVIKNSAPVTKTNDVKVNNPVQQKVNNPNPINIKSNSTNQSAPDKEVKNSPVSKNKNN